MALSPRSKKLPLWYTGNDGNRYDVHDPKQFAAWENTWGEPLEAIVPEPHHGGGKASTPRYTTTVDNDDLNYEAWLAHTAQVDADDRAYEAWLAELAADDRSYDAWVAHIRQAPVVVRTVAPVTQDGIYRLGDVIVKVQVAVNGSGNLYAKRLVVDGDHGSFVYEPGLIRRLSATDRMSVEEAAAFGKLYGFCIQCGRTLTDETSIAAGIGPVCAGRI